MSEPKIYTESDLIAYLKQAEDWTINKVAEQTQNMLARWRADFDQLEAAHNHVVDLKDTQLDDLRAQIEDLNAELDDARRELALAEIRVEELSE
jgi:hypothetical protein